MKDFLTTILLLASVLIVAALTQPAGAAGTTLQQPARGSLAVASVSAANVFNLADYGAVGDGVADDGPALQSALDAVAAAGGGTVFVPAGRYAIATPVFKNFAGLASSVTIRGVESPTTVDTTGNGQALSRGLELVSEFYPKTGEQNALSVSGLQNFLLTDIAFVGSSDVETDAAITLYLDAVEEATIRHCEFYGLSTQIGGAIVYAHGSGLRIEQTKFLGSTANSGLYSPVVQNLNWKGITIKDTVFIDYGQRPEMFSKTGLGAPYSWINIGDAAPTTNTSPRREVVLDTVFLDEGGYFGLSSLPLLYDASSAPIDLLYITGLRMNVSNFGTTGHNLYDLQRVLIEDSHYGWSHNAEAAISLQSVGNAILDRVECVAAAERIRADASTGRLTVINSVYTSLDSLAQTTNVVTTDDDPVLYVRQRFEAALGRAPDAAAHFHWSDLLVQCGADAPCLAARQAELGSYLALVPQPSFAVAGRVTGEDGEPLAGVEVALDGSQTATTVSDGDGSYLFAGLPTSGSYTITPAKKHYTFNAPSRVFITPGGDQTADFAATRNRHTISGRVVDGEGASVASVTIKLSGGQSATATTNAAGAYSFDGLPAGASYLISVSKAHYSFETESRWFDNLSATQFADFSAALNRHAISGRVVDATGGFVAGATLTLTGATGGAATSDAQGNFSFPNLPAGGDYVVTATKAHYSFSPASRPVTSLGSHQTMSFTGARANYTISGRVLEGAASLGGVTLTLSGSATATMTTGASGAYSFTVAAEGSYTITPAKTHYTFTLSSRTFTNLGGNATGDFAATLNRHTLSGRVVNINNAAIAGITLTLSGSQSATATTDANGDFSFPNLPAGGGYTVTPTLANHTFTPASSSYANLGANQYAVYVVALSVHTISGRVTSAAGLPFAGTTVRLSGSQSATTTTDANGSYAFNSLPATGNYEVTPSLKNHAFTPSSLTFNNLGANQTANFSGALNLHNISGRVTNPAGDPVAGVTMTLSGSQSATVTTDANGAYSFSALPAGANYMVAAAKPYYTFTPQMASFSNLEANTTLNLTATPQTLLEFAAASFSVSEDAGKIQINVTRKGDTSAASSVIYAASDGAARQGADLATVIGQLDFAPGETVKSFDVLVTDDAHVEGSEQVTLALRSPLGATLGPVASASLIINDNDGGQPGANPADEATFFVRQHYQDFLNREPDAAGLAFWAGRIAECGADAQCLAARRVDVSAAFFLSIEFQQTGYFVHRLYQSAYARAPRRVEEFLLDTQTTGNGVIVGAVGWEQRLEANKSALAERFVARAEFVARYPRTLTPSEFVAALNANTGAALTSAEANVAAGEFGGAANSSDTPARARALRRVAENAEFSRRELNPAFVLMQYFGYLQRNPHDPPDADLAGYNFWLRKLEQFGGDYRQAEMVKAFISSIEYRQRFGK